MVSRSGNYLFSPLQLRQNLFTNNIEIFINIGIQKPEHRYLTVIQIRDSGSVILKRRPDKCESPSNSMANFSEGQ